MARTLKSKSKDNQKVLTCLLYGEGKKDSKFIDNLISLKKFKDHTSSKWEFFTDHASGGSPKTVLEKCNRIISGRDFNLVICFIDIDLLKREYPKTWQNEIKNLEDRYPEIEIFWHEENLEDEILKVLKIPHKGKNAINRIARENVEKFINSKYWKRLLSIIKEREV